MSDPDVESGTVFCPQIMVDEVLATDEISNLLTNSILDLDRLLNDIIIVAALKTGRMASALWLIDQESGDLVVRASIGLGSKFLELAPTFESWSRFASLTKNQGVLQILDVSEEPDPVLVQRELEF